MSISKRMRLWTVAATAILVTACSTAQIKPGQAVQLKPGEGIAAVVIDSTDPIGDIQFQSRDNPDNQIRIAGLDNPGVNLFLFAVPAGTYCESVFHYGDWKFTPEGRENARCFDVLAGRTAYSGNLAPRAFGDRDVRMMQNYTWTQFENQMKRDYPDLVAKYPIVTP